MIVLTVFNLRNHKNAAHEKIVQTSGEVVSILLFYVVVFWLNAVGDGFSDVNREQLNQTRMFSLPSTHCIVMSRRELSLILILHITFSIQEDCFTTQQPPQKCVFPFIYQVRTGEFIFSKNLDFETSSSASSLIVISTSCLTPMIGSHVA